MKSLFIFGRFIFLFQAFLLLALCLCLPASAEPVPGPNYKAAPIYSTLPTDLFIVQLAPGTEQNKLEELLGQSGGKLLREISFDNDLKFFIVQSELGKAGELKQKLESSNIVASTCRNDLLSPQQVSFTKAPNDPVMPTEWDLPFMNFQKARAAGFPVNVPVTFYILDTGGTKMGSELPSNYVQYNFADPINPSGRIESVHDAGVHGTMVSQICATTDNNTLSAGAINLEGNRCSLNMFRISKDTDKQGFVNYVGILDALSFIYKNPKFPPGPINLSWNTAPPNTFNTNPALQLAAKKLQQKGFLLVVAAGNYGTPDNSPELYMRRVGAIGQNGHRASFSVYGNFKAYAPGQFIVIYYPGGANYGWTDGTSGAAPRWCAAILHVMSVLPPSKRNAVLADQIVMRTAIVTSDGCRVPDFYAAMKAAKSVH